MKAAWIASARRHRLDDIDGTTFEGLEFEWDPDKEGVVHAARGISFYEAMTVFVDPHAATAYDVAHSDEEVRYETIGRTWTGRLLVVSHTDRGSRIRLITARTPSKAERHEYEEG